jgi:hypothetical protein
MILEPDIKSQAHVTVRLSDYRIDDANQRVVCTATVIRKRKIAYTSQVIIPLAAIANRMHTYGLAEPMDGVRAIMREHCEMWLGLEKRGGLRDDIEMQAEDPAAPPAPAGG